MRSSPGRAETRARGSGERDFWREVERDLRCSAKGRPDERWAGCWFGSFPDFHACTQACAEGHTIAREPSFSVKRILLQDGNPETAHNHERSRTKMTSEPSNSTTDCSNAPWRSRWFLRPPGFPRDFHFGFSRCDAKLSIGNGCRSGTAAISDDRRQ